MKRIAALTLTALLALSLAACTDTPQNTTPSSASDATSMPQVSSAAPQTSATSAAPSTPATSAAEPTVKVDDTPKSVEYEVTFSGGHYTSGIDFPAGDYDIEAVEGGGNVSSSNAFSGGLNAIMGVASKGDMYDQKYSNISLPKGTVLSVSGVTVKLYSAEASAEALEARDNPNTETVELENGHFTAGKHFVAGTYDIIAVSGDGNVSSDNAFDGGINAIMGTSSNDMYEKEYKNIDLRDGVVLTVSGVKVKLVPSK